LAFEWEKLGTVKFGLVFEFMCWSAWALIWGLAKLFDNELWNIKIPLEIVIGL
jgi:hypothetical protein